MNTIKFVEEVRLKEAFWDKYKYRTNILASQFESIARHGGVDLLTAELVENKTTKETAIQFVSFEFKLDDIKKAIAQAEENSRFCHKSFIVIPLEKEKVINDRYKDYLKKAKYIGVMGVATDGRWTILHKPWTHKDEDLEYNQVLLKMLVNSNKAII